MLLELCSQNNNTKITGIFPPHCWFSSYSYARYLARMWWSSFILKYIHQVYWFPSHLQNKFLHLWLTRRVLQRQNFKAKLETFKLQYACCILIPHYNYCSIKPSYKGKGDILFFMHVIKFNNQWTWKNPAHYLSHPFPEPALMIICCALSSPDLNISPD